MSPTETLAVAYDHLYQGEDSKNILVLVYHNRILESRNLVYDLDSEKEIFTRVRHRARMLGSGREVTDSETQSWTAYFGCPPARRMMELGITTSSLTSSVPSPYSGVAIALMSSLQYRTADKFVGKWHMENNPKPVMEFVESSDNQLVVEVFLSPVGFLIWKFKVCVSCWKLLEDIVECFVMDGI